MSLNDLSTCLNVVMSTFGNAILWKIQRAPFRMQLLTLLNY